MRFGAVPLLAASRPYALGLRGRRVSREIASRSRVAVNLAARDLLHKASTSAGIPNLRSLQIYRICSCSDPACVLQSGPSPRRLLTCMACRQSQM